LLLLPLLLSWPIQKPAAEDAAPPASSLAAPPTIDDLRRMCERLVAASDRGDRHALGQFRRLYIGVYEQAVFEASANQPRTAAMMIPELDRWLAETAQAGSATAQFWMGASTKSLQRFGVPPLDLAEVARWYRASAEQGFAPAQDALGQFLGFFPELARAPFEAETWLLAAARQGHPSAAERLLQAIDIDRQRAGYRPDPAILAWLEQRAGAGDAVAVTLLEKLATQN
jgi:hypothetical protein